MNGGSWIREESWSREWALEWVGSYTCDGVWCLLQINLINISSTLLFIWIFSSFEFELFLYLLKEHTFFCIPFQRMNEGKKLNFRKYGKHVCMLEDVERRRRRRWRRYIYISHSFQKREWMFRWTIPILYWI